MGGIKAVAIVSAFITISFGYDESLSNLFTPSFIAAPAVEAVFQHRFTRGLGEDSYSFLGGAAVNAGVSGKVWENMGLSLDYFTPNDEIDFGASYSVPITGRSIAAYGTIHFFNFKENVSRDRLSNALYAAAITVRLLPARLWFTGNLGYDGYALVLAPSAGLLLRASEILDVTAEYCFAHDESLFSENSFAFGVKFNTWRHQFRVMFSNSLGNGGRNFMGGARDNRLRPGFSIQRLFDFKK